MNGKEALKLWKKEKPLLLQNTGISEILREIPVDLSTKLVDVKSVRAVLVKLQNKSSDKDIKKEKKAVSCIGKIVSSVENALGLIEKNRDDFVKYSTIAESTCKDYIKSVSNLKTVTTKDAQALTSSNVSACRNRLDMITARGYEACAVPRDIQVSMRAAFDDMESAAKNMAEVIKAANSKEIQPDQKSSYEKNWTEFVSNLKKLKPLIARIKALS